ncbi:MAG TPA: hypothetical protein G4N92_01910 [Anaerolineae bacterium]|nr:hypothetical protein [Anaerolineae bacterium]
MNDVKQFILLDYFKKISWFVIVLLMILGSSAGYLFSLFQPQIYEARAVIAVTIDYTKTGELSDIQEDQAMRGFGGIIDAPFTLKETVKAVQEAGIEINLEQFREKISLEREEFRWLLRVRDEDPNRVSELANIWAQQAMIVLTDASIHALNADYLQRYLESLGSCLERMANVNQAQVPCAFPYLEELLSEIESAGVLAHKEKEASLGLMPAISFFLSDQASPPASPILYHRNLLVFAGALVGFICALFINPILRK